MGPVRRKPRVTESFSNFLEQFKVIERKWFSWDYLKIPGTNSNNWWKTMTKMSHWEHYFLHRHQQKIQFFNQHRSTRPLWWKWTPNQITKKKHHRSKMTTASIWMEDTLVQQTRELRRRVPKEVIPLKKRHT